MIYTPGGKKVSTEFMIDFPTTVDLIVPKYSLIPRYRLEIFSYSL
jgi:hypothetical protein